MISVPNLSQEQEGLLDVTWEAFVNHWLRGSVDDVRVVNRSNFAEKKGLLLVGNFFCFVFLRIGCGGQI